MGEQVVAKDQWGQMIVYDEWSSLELRWLPTTADASDDEVMTTMEAFAAESVSRRPRTTSASTRVQGP